MTSKELAELLKVSKRTINNKIQKLKIKPTKIGNRYDIAAEDVEKIIKNIYKENYSEFLEQVKAFYPTTKIAEDILSKTENIENVNEKNENKNENNENINEKNGNKNKKIEQPSEKNENDITDRLIKMLEKSLEDKESTIRAQQNQIDMLIKSNAALTAKVTMLEDKSQERQQDIVVNEQSVAAPTPSEQTTEQEQPQKESWWKRLFK